MSEGELKYAYTFDPDATNNTAATVARMVLDGGPEVLDLGSGPAWVSRYLAAEHGRQVTCVDNDQDALASVAQSGLRSLTADLEDPAWHTVLDGASFDVVILADVLEHLRRPQDLLTALVDQQVLRPDGLLVVSVPNASHQAVIAELVLGDMHYTETGILDETHVRWLTRLSLERLLESSGFVLDRVERTTRTLEQTPTGERAAYLSAELRLELARLNPDTQTYQFVVRARPTGEKARLVALREQAEESERKFAQATMEVTALRQQLETASDERAHVAAAAAEQARRAQERFEQVQGRVQQLQGRVQQLEQRLGRVRRERNRLRQQLASNTEADQPGPEARSARRGVRGMLRRD